MENRVKECQLDFDADRTSASAMCINQPRPWLSSLAYVLMEAVRRLALAGTALADAHRLQATDDARHAISRPCRTIVDGRSWRGHVARLPLDLSTHCSRSFGSVGRGKAERLS
jgi:hypothetical protein